MSLTVVIIIVVLITLLLLYTILIGQTTKSSTLSVKKNTLRHELPPTIRGYSILIQPPLEPQTKDQRQAEFTKCYRSYKVTNKDKIKQQNQVYERHMVSKQETQQKKEESFIEMEKIEKNAAISKAQKVGNAFKNIAKTSNIHDDDD